MINYWIFVVNDWKDPHTRKTVLGTTIFENLQVHKVWGIGNGTQNRKNLSAGDKVIIYLAGTNGRKFLGSGTISSNCKPFTNNEVYPDIVKTILQGWGNFVTFEDFDKFDKPKSLDELAPNLEFIVKKDKAPFYFQSGVRSITKEDFDVIISEDLARISKKDNIENESQFILEKYMQEFMISNWQNINFGRELTIYKDDDGNTGEQYTTDIGYIDILAVDKNGNFVVIELKKGRESDKVVGQLLRYIGWVKKHLATRGQSVGGLVICKDNDQKLEYAISATQGIQIKYYNVNFKLVDTPSS